MVVDQGAQQRLLKEAVDALKGGNRVRARDLSLRVIQADRDVEAAWWCLYQVLDDAQGQTRALENVLRLNPRHEEAQQALIDLRQKRLGEAPPEWGRFLAESVLEPEDGLDNQYQCPYCGQPTGINDRRCPHCHGSLFARVARSSGSGTLQVVVLLLGISLAAGVMEMIAPALALGAAQTPTYRVEFRALMSFAFVPLLLGDFLQLAHPAAVRLVEIFGARAFLLAAILVSVRGRWSLGYFAGLLGAFADLLLSAYLFIGGYIGVGAALFNGALALAIGTVLFGPSDEFAINPERVLVKPDTNARSALDFYRRGHQYRRRGMWALAVAQWRRAVGLAPQVPAYYKHLGIGYAQIRRFSRSLRVLEEGRRQAPDDKDIAEIIALVKARAETHALLRK